MKGSKVERKISRLQLVHGPFSFVTFVWKWMSQRPLVVAGLVYHIKYDFFFSGAPNWRRIGLLGCANWLPVPVSLGSLYAYHV